MKTEIISFKDVQATYFISDQVLIRSEQDALNLMGEANTDAIILHDYNFEKEFFDLSTKTLGNVLQKFANYRVRLAIVGDFTKYPSKILKDLITESNRKRDYIFVTTLDDVKNIWAE